MKKRLSTLVAVVAVVAVTFAGPPVGAQVHDDTPPNPNFQCSGETGRECPPPASCISLLPESPVGFLACLLGTLDL